MSAPVSKITRLSARLRGTAAEEIPAPFEVRCDCGCMVHGVRTATWQQMSCPECRTTLFLLPTNVYPSTESVQSDVIGGSFVNRLRVVIGEMVPRRRTSQAASNGTTVPTQEKPASRGTRVPSPRRLPKITLPSLNPVQLARRIFTPIRLLALGTLLLIGGTSYWMHYQGQLEEAQTAWHQSTDALPGLLAGDDFETLQATLVTANAAGSLLGQEGPEWRILQNLLLETQAVNSVSYETLTSMLSELIRLKPHEDFKMDALQSALLNRTFVVDGYVDPAGTGSGDYMLDIPTMSASQPVVVSLHMPALSEYLDGLEVNRLIFAFRLDDMQSTTDSLKRGWNLRVAPESFVLFTSEQHCQRLGLSPESDPSLVELLGSQRKFVEESQNWESRLQRLDMVPEPAAEEDDT